VTTAEKTDPAQQDIVSSATGSDDIAHLIDRMGVRFGTARVKRLGFAESHIPEYAVVDLPWEHLAWERRLPAGTSSLNAPKSRQDAGAPRQQDSICTRPLRLFERPEEIEAIAEIPDGPPARFKWRRVMHEVAATEGPERIATEWWRDEKGNALTRDYFRVEDKDGRRFWLYREGLYGRETVRPRWFVHGLFA
jgi:protein ImuB